MQVTPTIAQYNQEIMQAHRVALQTLCDLLAEAADAPAADDDEGGFDHQRASIRLRAATAILRVRPIKDPQLDAPPASSQRAARSSSPATSARPALNPAHTEAATQPPEPNHRHATTARIRADASAPARIAAIAGGQLSGSA